MSEVPASPVAVRAAAMRAAAAARLRRFAQILEGKVEPASPTESGQAQALMWIVLVPPELIPKLFPDHPTWPEEPN